MNNRSLESLLNSIIPKLYSFTAILCDKPSKMEEWISKAYTALLVDDEKWSRAFLASITNQKMNTKTIKRILYKEMIKKLIKSSASFATEKAGMGNKFDELSIEEKSILFLLHIEKIEFEDVQEIMNLQRHQLIELQYSAKHKLSISNEAMHV